METLEKLSASFAGMQMNEMEMFGRIQEAVSFVTGLMLSKIPRRKVQQMAVFIANHLVERFQTKWDISDSEDVFTLGHFIISHPDGYRDPIIISAARDAVIESEDLNECYPTFLEALIRPNSPVYYRSIKTKQLWTALNDLSITTPLIRLVDVDMRKMFVENQIQRRIFTVDAFNRTRIGQLRERVCPPKSLQRYPSSNSNSPPGKSTSSPISSISDHRFAPGSSKSDESSMRFELSKNEPGVEWTTDQVLDKINGVSMRSNKDNHGDSFQNEQPFAKSIWSVDSLFPFD